ncbi:TPA: NAD(P)/FAD-dependent oxidoreductase [Stenotrophomonas maltophilia]|jgi:predicted Rossmann fold flavoprotein|uniref:NAD(P)/FAD-dependent oxidoreductase n=1 Tax=Stenotrophomonas TaxID=40323 RepID=UPI0009779960|nr:MULTISPECIES: NAD(P)/FAD-dependent oxidoreductase [Stenotrophomonas]MCV4211768.1 NAD(P)/FAD-dependent oxidoreductase [Pseudomonas cichorii]MBA0240148.1 NAD(P)/FAD-dependent oxidoreductase [Stenotrophomonas maltophilia]MBH1428685.1 NAD(P)/FAD-dependent oxidoreductase [Stenotrophomonas maltophilia]MBH1467151.1 NAD(P)/FAD-dependent oxidoreductase [Stenotrophomonas maltophilia]MBH1613665.1 NAD(P)/FAD-dependent oxidoreductase [Stenotrophomonas maltophilia]
MSTIRCDVVVIGAGAAGLMTAITAGQRGRQVQVIDHANKVGKKILMSGGGRCNFTNTGTTPANFLSANPHFCKSALARYTPWHFIELVSKHGIAYHEKELGQLFCDISSKQIVKMLVDECQEAGAQIRTECSVQRIEHGSDGFRVHTTQGLFHCASLVVATGGLSIPSMGATGFGYEIARQFGHQVLPTRAGLVPLTLSGKHQERLADLSGVALPIEARCNGKSFQNFMLLTHRGVSGPAILQISSFWQPGDALELDLLPGQDAGEWLRQMKRERPAAELRTVLAEVLPKRLAQRLCEHWLPDRPVRQLDEPVLRQAAQLLGAFPLVASGTEGYRTAEVTLGGVDTAEVSSSTMESKRVPGLHFVGEVLDVTGWLGGYNFQWAWASGHAAGGVV